MADYVFPERQWDPPLAQVYPAPKIGSRPANDDEIPARVIGLRVLAEAHGWKVKTTYSRGTRPGRPPRVIDSIALRMRRDEVSIWAVWLDGKFDAAMIWRTGAVPVMAKLSEIRKEAVDE